MTSPSGLDTNGIAVGTRRRGPFPAHLATDQPCRRYSVFQPLAKLPRSCGIKFRGLAGRQKAFAPLNPILPKVLVDVVLAKPDPAPDFIVGDVPTVHPPFQSSLGNDQHLTNL